MPFLTPTLLYPGLGLAGEYQKVNPQAELHADREKQNRVMEEADAKTHLSESTRCKYLYTHLVAFKFGFHNLKV